MESAVDILERLQKKENARCNAIQQILRKLQGQFPEVILGNLDWDWILMEPDWYAQPFIKRLHELQLQ